MDPFDALDFTLEEALQADEQLRTRPGTRDGRVCACGHSAGRHQTDYGLNVCKPSAMQCACKTFRAVVEVSDTRPFLRKTEGAGPMHALGRGIAVALSKGAEVTWLIDLKCDRCKQEAKLTPVPVTQSGIAVSHDTGFNAMLCQTCRENV